MDLMYFSYEGDLYAATMSYILASAREAAKTAIGLAELPLLQSTTRNGNRFLITEERIWHKVWTSRDYADDFIVFVLEKKGLGGNGKRQRENEQGREGEDGRDNGKDKGKGRVVEGQPAEGGNVGQRENEVVAGPSGAANAARQAAAPLKKVPDAPPPPAAPPAIPQQRDIKPKPEPLSPVLPPAALPNAPILPLPAAPGAPIPAYAPPQAVAPQDFKPPLPPAPPRPEDPPLPVEHIITALSRNDDPERHVVLKFVVFFPSSKLHRYEITARKAETFDEIYSALETYLRYAKSTLLEKVPEWSYSFSQGSQQGQQDCIAGGDSPVILVQRGAYTYEQLEGKAGGEFMVFEK